jgi:hypothetical protein
MPLPTTGCGNPSNRPIQTSNGLFEGVSGVWKNSFQLVLPECDLLHIFARFESLCLLVLIHSVGWRFNILSRSRDRFSRNLAVFYRISQILPRFRFRDLLRPRDGPFVRISSFLDRLPSESCSFHSSGMMTEGVRRIFDHDENPQARRTQRLRWMGSVVAFLQEWIAARIWEGVS